MRIVRCRKNGADCLAARHSTGGFTLLKGDLFGHFEDTGHEVVPGKILAPLVPSAIFCIGLNYRRHAEETNAKIPEYPILFFKSPSSVQDPNEPILLPRGLRSDKVDYEAELAVVIGKRCKNVTAEQALEYVLGYTCANDVSARDWQLNGGGGQWCRGKTFDTFCPLGPELVTSDEITHPNKLTIRSLLNGEVMQDSNTSDMIFPVAEIIAFLSASTTLMPGTVILTGTPEGVGMARNPAVWLKPNDRIDIEIGEIGLLSNPVVEEQV